MNYYQKIYDLLTEGSIGFKRFDRQMKARDKADLKGNYLKSNKINAQMGKINRKRPGRILARLDRHSPASNKYLNSIERRNAGK